MNDIETTGDEFAAAENDETPAETQAHDDAGSDAGDAELDALEGAFDAVDAALKALDADDLDAAEALAASLGGAGDDEPSTEPAPSTED